MREGYFDPGLTESEEALFGEVVDDEKLDLVGSMFSTHQD
jgi:hypothetical protein